MSHRPDTLALNMPIPSGDQLKAARTAAGLSQAQAAELLGYPLQTGSRGGLQSRTWQALESTSDERSMQGPVFAMFLLLTGQHPEFRLERKLPAGSVKDTATDGEEAISPE
ncbi:DNA-binding transcriptional regulator [Acidovorax sp. A1169]|uniref:helix-turn-helix domain-containing protein n=1 Tax=Acidovorax sp. A1169 TaxID=3059524 RepID=UPI002737BD50|nr:helix-turn-helix transcriptional regulator [Acidovorax sp. A1169]MDP4074649.1 helix-turn-helix transcriptional regulator [Acidovorax sp. A1169]